MRALDVARYVAGHPLNQGQRGRALLRLLRWQLASRLSPNPIILPFVDGIRMSVERGMTGATGNYYCGLHEAEDMAFVLHCLQPGDAFYDIGANVGSYTLLAAAAGVDRVHAFEPSPGTGDRLWRNVVLNGLEDRVSLHRLALGAEHGDVAFSVGRDTTNHVLSAAESGDESETVPVRRFDDYFDAGRPAFVKMDVEGFESQVLAGAEAALDHPSLFGMLVEDNGSGRRYGRDDSISTLLTSRGFAPFSYDPWKRKLDPRRGAGTTGNLLFLRDPESMQVRVAAARRFKLVNGWI